VPITVGLMDAGYLLAARGLAILLILAVSAAFGLLLAGWVSCRNCFSTNHCPQETGCDPLLHNHGDGVRNRRDDRRLWSEPHGTPTLSVAANHPGPVQYNYRYAVLLLSGVSFADYRPAKEIMTFLLGPATVALAIPLYKNRGGFFSQLVPAGLGLLAGSLGTMIVAMLAARILGFSPELLSSIAIKSTTVPIAVEIARIVHGNPALTAIFVVIIGMIGASFGPWLMDRVGVTHRFHGDWRSERSRKGRAPHRQQPKASCPAPSPASRWGSARCGMQITGRALDRACFLWVAVGPGLRTLSQEVHQLATSRSG
jgi:hypothetical protein